jgi:hypothetical protein
MPRESPVATLLQLLPRLLKLLLATPLSRRLLSQRAIRQTRTSLLARGVPWLHPAALPGSNRGSLGLDEHLLVHFDGLLFLTNSTTIPPTPGIAKLFLEFPERSLHAHLVFHRSF